MPNPKSFRSTIRKDLESYVDQCSDELNSANASSIKIDLHCHDKNSDVPDETLGRILRVPETWLPTADLMRTLKSNGANAFTITNHNNARSCWNLLDKGEDILPGAEFSCTLPDLDIGVHVLTFGFTPAQEPRLNRLRKNIYKFLEYTCDENIPTVLAHPLNFFSPKGLPSIELMDRFAVLFERFEGVNGQRESWQNMLTVRWLQGLDQEAIEMAGRRTGIDPKTFCRRPFVKNITGGSDCHMGIFAGSTGTVLKLDPIQFEMHKVQMGKGKLRRSDLALLALREGAMGPYGAHCEEEKLNVAFLDYFCQVALNMEDPGLIRLLLHRGTTNEKLQALAIANGMFELRRHKYTSKFLGLFHECLQGRKPGWFTQWMASKAFKPLLSQMESIATARNHSPEKLVGVLNTALPTMFNQLSALLTDRIKAKVKEMEKENIKLSPAELIGKIELPVHFRALMGQAPATHDAGPSPIDLGKWSDGLPFPALAAIALGGSAFAASKVLYGKRKFLQELALNIGHYEHPRRALWITDTLEDKNGVSHVLQQMLAEARRKNLPIDFLACSTGNKNGLQSGDHLVLLPAVSEFTLPFYPDQVIRLPGLLDLQKTFLEGGYDRIICSTEAPMGAFALYLKNAFNVPAYFYTHSDWLDFSKRVLKYDRRKQDRTRRFLRAFYRRFDGVFLLNNEQKENFASTSMGLDPKRLHLTAHWADDKFYPRPVIKENVFQFENSNQGPVLLYAGRLSEEKGVLDIPGIYEQIKKEIPNAKLAFAGTGPCLDKLKALCPEAQFLGWLAADALAEAYSAADLLLLPSWFDTFSCSLLEALGCGLPAIAFNSKGPRDILSEGRGGKLAESTSEMAAMAIGLLNDPSQILELKKLALARAADYRRESIMEKMLEDLELNASTKDESSELIQKEKTKPISRRKSAKMEMAFESNQAFIGELLSIMGV